MNTLEMLRRFDADVVIGMSAALLKGTVVLSACGLAATLARRSAAATRHWIWFLGLLALPTALLLSDALPAWRVLPAGIAWRSSAAMSDPGKPASRAAEVRIVGERAEAEATQTFHDSVVPAASVSSEQAPPAVPIPARNSVEVSPALPNPAAGGATLQWPQFLLIAWLVGGVTAFVPLLLGAVSLRRLERNCRPVPPDWRDLAARAAGKLGLSKQVIFVQTDRRTIPMTWGIVRPRVLLPSEASEWSFEHRRDVLLHELAHIQRKDCLIDFISRFIGSAFWFHPLAWLALHRMRDLRERACDDRVIASGSDPAQYADHLLQIVASLAAPRAKLGGIAMARSAQIKRRLRAILDDKERRHPARTAVVLALVFLVVIIEAPLAMLRAAEPSKSVDAAERPAGAPTAPATQPAMFVEGTVVDPEGHPVADAEIAIVMRRYDRRQAMDYLGVDVLAQCRSDAQGHYRLPHPPESEPLPWWTFIRATAAGRVYVWQEFHRERQTYSPMVLPPAARVIGDVVDEQGTPIAGAAVVFQQIENPVVTDAQGHFVSEKALPVKSTGRSPSSSGNVQVYGAGHVVASVQIPEVGAGLETAVHVVLERGVLVRGILSDADTGGPLEGFYVLAEPREKGLKSRDFTSQSDRNGHYEIRLPAGGFMLHPASANDANYYPLVDNREVRAVAGAEPIDVDLRFRRGRSISGRLGDAGSLDLESLQIEAAQPGTGWSVTPHWRSHLAEFAKDGSFHFIGLKPGQWNLMIASADLLYTQSVELSADRDVGEVQITLPPNVVARLGTVVKGVVQSANGQPAGGAQVDLHTQESAASPNRWIDQTAKTAPDGSFAFRNVDPNHPWSLLIRNAATTEGAAIALSREQLNDEIKVTLQPGAELSGTVRDADGKGLPDYGVAIAEPMPKLRPGETVTVRTLLRSQTDEQGHFKITGFVPRPDVNRFELMASPIKSPEGRGISPRSYKDLDIRAGSKQDGFDFVVRETPRLLEIMPKDVATQPATRPGVR